MKKWFAVSIFLILFGSFLFYNSRKIPELGDEGYITELPPDVRNVLGSQANLAEVSLRVPILLYHYVEYVKDKNDTFRQSLNIPPHVLTSQIETLKEAGYTFITTSELTDAIAGKIKLPQKIVILTFDDGYRDFYTDVFPILKKEQVKAVEYVIPDFLNRPNFMFSFQLAEIAKNSLVEIGAHTMDHVWLKGINEKTASYQISQSKKTLESMLNTPINSFAYPYGAFDQQTMQLTKTAGFTNAVSTVPGIEHSLNTRYYLYRLRPGYRTGQELLNYLKQDTFKAW